MIPLCCCPTNVAPTPTSTPSAFSAVLTNAATTTTTTTSTTTVTHKTNNIHKIKLMDIFLMALIHCLLFFIYAHHHSHSYYSRLLPVRHDDTTATNDFLRQQLDRFKKGRSHDNNNNKNNDSNNTNDNINNNHIIHYEPNYPKLTRLHEFPTAASEKEMAKHDRYMIHSILYTEMLSQEYLHKHWKLPDNRKRGGPWRFEKKVCMTVRINNNNNNNNKKKNGKLPYVHALIMSLMGGHVQGEYREGLNKIVPAGHRLLSFVDLNLLRVGGRTRDGKEEDYSDNDEDDEDDIQKKVWNLNFVKVHDIQHRHGYGKMMTTTTTTRTNYNSRKLEKIIQILQSARICVESELPWCLVMEEYTVVSIEFLNSLKRFVISPLESFAASHRMDATESDGEVFRRKKKMSVISLFSAYNTETASVMRVHDVEYSRNQYERDRGKINSERKALGLKEYQFQYEMYPIVEKGTSLNGGGSDDNDDDDDNSLQGGFDTAMLFHTSMVQSDLIPMLERMKRQEERRIAMERFKGFFGLSHDGQGVVEQPLDIEREFSLYTGIKRYRVEPSLVNRIGFYDPDFIWNGNDEFVQTSKLGITNWLTDPRFVFEPGEYYEGIDEYCEMDDGTWIWDALHDHRRKSCCDEKFAKDERCLEDE